MLKKHRRQDWYVSEVKQIHWDSILESCFVSYAIVKSPSKPYIVVHLFSIAYSVYINSGTCNVGIIDHSYIPGGLVCSLNPVSGAYT